MTEVSCFAVWKLFASISTKLDLIQVYAQPYQFLSACFRNLTNAINSSYYQAFTMRNVWESVVSEAWRGSTFVLTGHTMQPDRFLNRILIAYFFFLEGKCHNLTTVEWVGFKLTFLEKDICHDHEIDILRSLAKLQLRYVLKNVLFQQILILGYFP